MLPNAILKPILKPILKLFSRKSLLIFFWTVFGTGFWTTRKKATNKKLDDPEKNRTTRPKNWTTVRIDFWTAHREDKFGASVPQNEVYTKDQLVCKAIVASLGFNETCAERCRTYSHKSERVQISLNRCVSKLGLGHDDPKKSDKFLSGRFWYVTYF